MTYGVSERMFEKYVKSILEKAGANSPEKLISIVSSEEDSIIWWSNAFHTVGAHYVRGLQGVTDCYNNWISQLNAKNPNLWILGKDYLDRPIEGGTIKEYINDRR